MNDNKPKHITKILENKLHNKLNKGWYNAKKNKYFKSVIKKYNDILPCYICNIHTHISNIACCKILSRKLILNDLINVFVLCDKCNFENHDICAPDNMGDVISHRASTDLITHDIEFYYKLFDERNILLIEKIYKIQETINKNTSYLLQLTKENEILNSNLNIEFEKNKMLVNYSTVNNGLIENIRRQQIELYDNIEIQTENIKKKILESHKSMIDNSKTLFDMMDNNFNKLVDFQDLSNPKSSICHICNIYNIDIVLSPCRHTLCNNCLKNIKHNFNNTNINEDDTYKCPYCRRFIESNDVIFI